ncbi:S-formylglutathione hydrolase [Ranunculus cassubicifolius]
MTKKPIEVSSSKTFGGYTKRYKHYSPVLSCTMHFQDFFLNSGAQRVASAEGVALIAPDTSPRGLDIEGEEDGWDLGTGAGFFVNATQEKWKNYRMYDYVVKELPKLLADNFDQLDTLRASVCGFAMGGHGALMIFLKNIDKYKSVSAMAPITNPSNVELCRKAFLNYFGDNKSEWEEYDATLLVAKHNNIERTILDTALLPHMFEEACKKANVSLRLRLQPGYNHSYNFVATFIGDHIRHHAKVLSQ